MKRAVLFAVAAAVALPLLVTADGHSPIEQRQELMEQTRDALRPMIGMSRGQVDFSAETVQESLAVFAMVAEKAPALFPEGSDSGFETEARDTIWSDREGFDQAFVNFADAVTAAQGVEIDSVDALKPALQGVLKTCRGCHDDYRVEKD